MRASLRAVVDELKRLKAEGVTALPVSSESIALLRKVVGKLHPAAPATPAVSASSAAQSTASAGLYAERTASSPLSASSARTRAVAPAQTPRLPTPSPEPVLPPPPGGTLPEGDKETRWAWLKDFVTHHPVCRANVRPGKLPVLGVGSRDAKIMFVGEAPGAEEEVRGEPFVGPAGQLLTRMIVAMGLKREEVYIGNIMNWRPQTPTAAGAEQIGNRPPSQAEMDFCLPFFHAQVAIVNPDVLVALGKTAAQGMLGFGNVKTLGQVRGKWHQFDGKPLRVTYHPSYLLHQADQSSARAKQSKRMVWEDLLHVMERVGLPISEKQRGYFL